MNGRKKQTRQKVWDTIPVDWNYYNRKVGHIIDDWSLWFRPNCSLDSRLHLYVKVSQFAPVIGKIWKVKNWRDILETMEGIKPSRLRKPGCQVHFVDHDAHGVGCYIYWMCDTHPWHIHVPNARHDEGCDVQSRGHVTWRFQCEDESDLSLPRIE